jgi:sentrin-specific protease 1
MNFYFAHLQREHCLHAGNRVDTILINTFFAAKLARNGHAGVRKWLSKRALRRMLGTSTSIASIFGLRQLLIPVLCGNMHWCLAVVNFPRRNIQFYDSALDVYNSGSECEWSGAREETFLLLLKWLHQEFDDTVATDCSEIRFDAHEWTTCTAQCPQRVSGFANNIGCQYNNSSTNTQDPTAEGNCGVFVSTAAECITRGVPLLYSAHHMAQYRHRILAAIIASAAD